MTLDSKVALKEVAPCQKELRVEVPAEAVDAEFESVYQDMKRVAHVPGFRVGSAPRDLLERYHGAKAREQVLRRLVGRSLDEAMAAQGNLDVVGHPQVAEVQLEAHKPLTYVAQVEVAPEVPLGRYKGLKLARPKREVSEESVGQVLERLRRTHAELKPVLEDRPAAEGDFLLADLTERRPGKPPKSAEAPGSASSSRSQRDVLIHLDLAKDPDGVFKGLLGTKVGESRTVTLKDGVALAVNLKALKAEDVPPLDDAFAKLVGPYETLDSLREAVRADLGRQAEALDRQALEAQAFQQMIEGWRFEVPPSLVASQARRILKERALELMSRGVAPEKVQDQAQALTDQAKLDALKQVRLFYILRRIAAAEKLSATQEEVEERVKALAQQMQMKLEDLRGDLEAKDLMGELAWGIIRQKVADLLLREAEIEES